MPTVPNWSSRPDNVVCWSCEHFQPYRYEFGGNGDPDLVYGCEGECRKYPPRSITDKVDDTDTETHSIRGYCHYIVFGNVQWCSGYQRALQSYYPAAPIGSVNCNHQNYADLIYPAEYNAYASPPYSKRPVTESCWYCTHFQRLYQTAIDIENMCGGFCCIEPGPQQQYDFEIGVGFDNDFQNMPRIQHGTAMWCNRWERSPFDVPDPFDAGQGECTWSPPP